MPAFGTTFGLADLQATSLTLTVNPQRMPAGAGRGRLASNEPALTAAGGLMPAGAGQGYLQAAGVDLSMETLLGTSPGRAVMAAELLPEGFEVDVPLPRASDEAIIGCSGVGLLRSDIKRLSLVDVALQVYALWGFQVGRVGDMNGYGLDSIVAWVNAAMQLIFSRAERLDYFNTETLTLTVPTTGTLALDSSIQRIQGPVRIADTLRPLRPLASRSELEQFAAYYLDSAQIPAFPLAYYLDSSRAAEPDSVALAIWLAPAPTADLDIKVDVTKEPPRYDHIDVQRGIALELPHKWAETILLPIVRKWASADTLMPGGTRQAVQPQVDAQYAAAIAVLGLADPSPPATAKPSTSSEARA